MRWIGLVLSLIGLIPEFGSAIKGAGRIVIAGATSALAHLADILEFFRRLLPGSFDYSSVYDFIISHWDEGVLLARDNYRRIAQNLNALGTSFWMRLMSNASEIRRVIDEFIANGASRIDEALIGIRQYFNDLLDTLLPSHAMSSEGISMPIPDRTPELPTHMEMSGSGPMGAGTSVARRIAGRQVTDPILLGQLRQDFEVIAGFRSTVTLPPARTASGNPTISRLDIMGQEVYGVSTSAASPSRSREEIAAMQELVREAYGTAPHIVAMEHAEADAIISAFNNNLSATAAIMHVDRPLCGFCSTSLRRLLPLIGMRNLTIYQLVPETGEIWEATINAVN
jgi:hypothetical protein